MRSVCGMVAVAVNGKYGYINTFEQWIVQPQYVVAGDFSEGLAAVQATTGKYGYIDCSGNMTIPASFDYAEIFVKGRAKVGMRKKTIMSSIFGEAAGAAMAYEYIYLEDISASQSMPVTLNQDSVSVESSDAQALENLTHRHPDNKYIIVNQDNSRNVLSRSGVLIPISSTASMIVYADGMIALIDKSKLAWYDASGINIWPFAK